MVDYRSLIDFCKDFEQHRNMANSLTVSEHAAFYPHNNQHRQRKQHNPNNLLTHPLCEQSSSVAVYIVILVLVLGACRFLFTPYFKYVCHEAAKILPATFLLINDIIYHAPIADASRAILMFVFVIAAWEIYQYKSRKCENPHCRGLRNAAEFDIQLESKECVKTLPPSPKDLVGSRQLELGEDHEELEAEFTQMVPLNGMED